MDRRHYLTTAAGAIAGLATGATLRSGTGAARADVQMDSLSVSDADAETEDGTVADVGLRVSGRWEYDLPSGKSPASRQVVAAAGTAATDAEAIAATTAEAQFLSSHGEYDLEGSLLDAEPFSAEQFAAPGPGETATVDVWTAVVLSVFDGDDNLLASAEVTDTGSVDVTEMAYKPSEHGDVGGSGELVVVPPS